MSIKRYELELYHCNGGEMLVSETGDYVSYEDYAESVRYGRQADITIENLERKVEQLAAENSALKDAFGPGDAVLNFLTIALRHTTYDQIDLDDVTLAFKMSLPETPATDAFLAEVRASGVEMYADNLDSSADDAERDGFDDAVKFLRSEASGVRLFAAQLRQGGAV